MMVERRLDIALPELIAKTEADREVEHDIDVGGRAPASLCRFTPRVNESSCLHTGGEWTQVGCGTEAERTLLRTVFVSEQEALEARDAMEQTIESQAPV
jgi:hypothetical protein